MRRFRISPLLFSSLQLLAISTPLLILLSLIIAAAFLLGDRARLWIASLEVAFYVLATGGMALMYLVWWMSMTFRGIVATPKRPWEISIVDEQIHIRSHCFVVSFPITKPKEIVEVWDGGFDQLKGLEDKGLLISFGPLYRLTVPGSSNNFEGAVASIKSRREIVNREIE